MECERTAELLPWLENGTLDGAEKRRVVEHLATCDRCRRELRRTEDALALYEGHLPAELLVDHALGTPLSDGRRELVERHLESCRRCAEEVALVRKRPEQGGSERPPTVAKIGRPPVTPRSAAPRRLAVAAVLAALIAGGGWLWSWQRLAGERAHWRQREGVLLERIERLAGPRLNTPVVELLPSAAEDPLRGTPADGVEPINELTLPAGAELVTLTLLSEWRQPDGVHTVELVDAGGEVRWRRQGLTRDPDGLFTLTLPSALLPAGSFTLRVHPRGEPDRAVLYRVAVKAGG